MRKFGSSLCQLFRTTFWNNCFFYFYLPACRASRRKIEWNSLGSRYMMWMLDRERRLPLEWTFLYFPFTLSNLNAFSQISNEVLFVCIAVSLRYLWNGRSRIMSDFIKYLMHFLKYQKYFSRSFHPIFLGYRWDGPVCISSFLHFLKRQKHQAYLGFLYRDFKAQECLKVNGTRQFLVSGDNLWEENIYVIKQKYRYVRR
jgi:hypothetical protein